jgi:hypothetical protein
LARGDISSALRYATIAFFVLAAVFGLALSGECVDDASADPCCWRIDRHEPLLHLIRRILRVVAVGVMPALSAPELALRCSAHSRRREALSFPVAAPSAMRI